MLEQHSTGTKAIGHRKVQGLRHENSMQELGMHYTFGGEQPGRMSFIGIRTVPGDVRKKALHMVTQTGTVEHQLRPQ